MSLFNASDKALQAAALKAGIRTAEQTAEAGLGVGVVGGVVVGTVGGDAFTLDYKTLLGGILFVLIAAILAGLKSYLSIASNGLPQQYADAAGSSTAVSAAVSTLAAAGVNPAGTPLTVSQTFQSTPSLPDGVVPLTAETAAQEPVS